MTTRNGISPETSSGRRSLRLVPRPRPESSPTDLVQSSDLVEISSAKGITAVAESSELVRLPKTAPPAESAVRRSPRVAAAQLTGLVLLLAGLWGGWLEPSLSPALRATDLTIVLPALGHVAFISWGVVVILALLLVVVGFLPWGYRRPAVTRMAAVLSLGSCVGFLLQTAFVDVTLQQRLGRDETDLADLARLVGYKIPRPNVTTLGPIPVPAAAADVLSALHWGFYVALAGALVLTVGAVSQERSGIVGSKRDRLLVNWVTAALTVGLAVTLIQSTVAGWGVRRAEASAASGDDAAAVVKYESALDRNGGLFDDPDVLAQFGMSQLRLGPADGPAAQLASSRLQLQAGKDLRALQVIGAATGRWPQYPALKYEFTDQAVEYLRVHGTPRPVRVLVTRGNESALVRISLAKYELLNGDNPAAIADAGAADALAADNDVRSVALTYLSVAQSRSGNLVLGRQTLLAAVDADDDYVNVMARSILTGLYTTLPL